MTSSSMITPILLLRANIDYLSCSITILINIVLILQILRRQTSRTFKNCLVINTSLNLICSCSILLISVTLTVQYSISLYINLHLCRIIGYLMNSFSHGIMYSYVLLSINLFHSRNCQLSKILIFSEIILQWLLAFVIPLFINQIDFQTKGRFCYARQLSLMILNSLTELFLPIVFISIFNLSIYLHLQKLRRNINITEKRKSNPFHRTPSRLYRRQTDKHIKLLRQTIAFFLVFFVGWGIFLLMVIFDRYQIIPDDIYLIILSFPSLSLLIITLLIRYWNKSIEKPILTSIIRNSLSTTTIRLSHPIHINFIE